MADDKIVAVIPALNEGSTISGVLRGIKDYVDEVILVDDASTDNTSNIAIEEGAVVVSNTVNQGYDSSVDRGFSAASKRKATVILTFDADGQHIPSDIPGIIEPILKKEADIVVGRRPYCARFFEKIFALYSKHKIGIDDPLCGLKAYKAEVYDDIGYFDKISSIGTELLFNAKRKGYRVTQKDIILNKRIDTPRFGRKISANFKIAKALLKTLFLNGV